MTPNAKELQFARTTSPKNYKPPPPKKKQVPPKKIQCLSQLIWGRAFQRNYPRVSISFRKKDIRDQRDDTPPPVVSLTTSGHHINPGMVSLKSQYPN